MTVESGLKLLQQLDTYRPKSLTLLFQELATAQQFGLGDVINGLVESEHAFPVQTPEVCYQTFAPAFAPKAAGCIVPRPALANYEQRYGYLSLRIHPDRYHENASLARANYECSAWVGGTQPKPQGINFGLENQRLCRDQFGHQLPATLPACTEAKLVVATAIKSRYYGGNSPQLRETIVQWEQNYLVRRLQALFSPVVSKLAVPPTIAKSIPSIDDAQKLEIIRLLAQDPFVNQSWLASVIALGPKLNEDWKPIRLLGAMLDPGEEELSGTLRKRTGAEQASESHKAISIGVNSLLDLAGQLPKTAKYQPIVAGLALETKRLEDPQVVSSLLPMDTIGYSGAIKAAVSVLDTLPITQTGQKDAKMSPAEQALPKKAGIGLAVKAGSWANATATVRNALNSTRNEAAEPREDGKAPSFAKDPLGPSNLSSSEYLEALLLAKPNSAR